MIAALAISAFILLVLISRFILWHRVKHYYRPHAFDHDIIQLNADLSASRHEPTGITPGGASYVWYDDYVKGTYREPPYGRY